MKIKPCIVKGTSGLGVSLLPLYCQVMTLFKRQQPCREQAHFYNIRMKTAGRWISHRIAVVLYFWVISSRLPTSFGNVNLWPSFHEARI